MTRIAPDRQSSRRPGAIETMRRWPWPPLIVGMLLASRPTAQSADVAPEHPGPGPAAAMCDSRAIEGRYSGQWLLGDGRGPEKIGLVVVARGGKEYTATLYHGGLPDERGESPMDPEPITLSGSCRDFTLVLDGKIPFRLQYIHGRFTALDDANDYRGHFTRAVP